MTPEPPPAARPPGLRGHVRAVVFLLFALVIVGNPFAAHALGIRHQAVRGWFMFSSVGRDATQVRFSTVGADGTLEEIDRFEVLLSPGAKVPTGRNRKVADADSAKKIARTLCRRLGPGADVRVEFKKATKTGWSRKLDGRTNECTRQAERGEP